MLEIKGDFPMNKILVTYATFSGSTADVAHFIAQELTSKGAQVDVLPLLQVKDLQTYQAVILGAPMILGWHRQALAFLKQNHTVLQRIPLAIFVTAMSLTVSGEEQVQGVPVYVNEYLGKPPKNPDRLSFKERYASVSNYAAPILKAARLAKPISIAFFAGRLDLYRLKWWAKVFVILVIQAQPGDRRNWDAIRDWTTQILSDLG
jgi:menaquinone-dependent protoporphyrinogen oxidase